MEQRRWGRRLRVALLVVGMSSGLGTVPASRAGAIALLGKPEGRAQRLPTELASASHRALARAALAQAGPALLATSPLTWTQQAELTSTAQTDNDSFGAAVAVSGDTAVVGASSAPFPSNIGVAYIFARSGSAWSQQAALSDPGGVPFDQFGYAVAVSGDTAVVGAIGAAGGTTASGAAYVYVRSGGTWMLQATLAASDGAYNDGFGWSVAISGTTIVVGAPAKNNQEGATYVFARTGNTWTQQAEVSYPGGVLYAEFGWAVALSGDTAVVSAAQAPVAYVYVRRGGTWSLQATLADPGPAYGRSYGVAVAVAGDTALVSLTESPFRVNGVVYVFGRSGTTWTLQTALTPPAGATNSSFGLAVALSGATAVVGGEGAWTFMGHGSTWSAPVQLIPADRPANLMGLAVGVWANTALIGATAAPAAAYVFVRHRVGDAAPADDSGTALRPAWIGRVR